jgi:hypothetical protein
MRSSSDEKKASRLQARLASLERQADAASAQLNATLSAADREILKTQIAQIERELTETDQALRALDAAAMQKGSGEPDAPPPLFGAGRRWAVLVGVNRHDDKRNYGALKRAVPDADALRDRLVASGYEPGCIQMRTDRTKKKPLKAEILATLQAAADATEPDDLLLFYYSGHGEAASGHSYLVARDGRKSVLDHTAVPMAIVEQIMRGAPARAKVIILDACHSGAKIGIRGAQPMSEEFIRHVFEQAEGLAILSACTHGQLSYESDELAQGVFTRFLLEALSGAADRDGKGFVTVQDVNRHVVHGVRGWAVAEAVAQTPTLQSGMTGDIILADFRRKAGTE